MALIFFVEGPATRETVRVVHGNEAYLPFRRLFVGEEYVVIVRLTDAGVRVMPVAIEGPGIEHDHSGNVFGVDDGRQILFVSAPGTTFLRPCNERGPGLSLPATSKRNLVDFIER